MCSMNGRKFQYASAMSWMEKIRWKFRRRPVVTTSWSAVTRCFRGGGVRRKELQSSISYPNWLVTIWRSWRKRPGLGSAWSQLVRTGIIRFLLTSSRMSYRQLYPGESRIDSDFVKLLRLLLKTTQGAHDGGFGSNVDGQRAARSRGPADFREADGRIPKTTGLPDVSGPPPQDRTAAVLHLRTVQGRRRARSPPDFSSLLAARSQGPAQSRGPGGMSPVRKIGIGR